MSAVEEYTAKEELRIKVRKPDSITQQRGKKIALASSAAAPTL